MSIYGQFDICGILGDQAGEDLLEKTKTTKIILAGIEEVIPNPENFYSTRQEEIELLAENIFENGLLHDLVCYKDGNRYTLISGHRRYMALQQLITEGKQYKYHGMDITGKVPITLIENPKNPHMIGLQLISANHQRQMTADEKRTVIRNTLSCLNELEKVGKFSWPKGIRTCTVLAEKTGIAEHFIKDYLAESGLTKSGIPDPDTEEKNRKSKEVTEEMKSVKRFTKAIRTLNKRAADFDWNILSELNEKEISDIKDQLKQLIDRLQTYVD